MSCRRRRRRASRISLLPRRTSINAPGFWQTRNPLACLLWPVSLAFSLLVRLRRALIQPQRLPVPVIVVGGITVGGAGKTPLTLWLVDALRKHGHVPGIVSRGYGGEVLGVAEVKTCSEPRM